MSSLVDVVKYAVVAQDLDSEPTAILLERRWFAAQSATRGLQAECDLLQEALSLAQVAWQRARTQLAEFQALSDALESELTAIDTTPTSIARCDGRSVMSAA